MYTIKEIKKELQEQGLSISKCNMSFNGSPVYKVWDATITSEQFANKYTKSDIIHEFL